jgi:glucosyl-3-phosphoglycerate synthase
MVGSETSANAAFRTALAHAYRGEAAHALRRSESLAVINGLPFDLGSETAVVETFALRLDQI